MKKKVIITTIILILAATALSVIIFYTRPFPADYETFIGMRTDMIKALKARGAAERDINRYFENYNLNLNPLYSFMFKTGYLSLYLKSYESNTIDTATINQLEIGDSGTFFDFTFMIRPKTELSLPFFHGDALKALPGVDGALYMDFYSFNNTMPLDNFFGNRISMIEKARSLAAPYWKHEGFGELTHHLDRYKSQYRFEILEPEKVPEADRIAYFETVRECFRLYSEAYLDSLEEHRAAINPDAAAANRKGIEDFVEILYEHDVAVRMGKMIFPEKDFDKYFLNGFWGTGE